MIGGAGVEVVGVRLSLGRSRRRGWAACGGVGLSADDDGVVGRVVVWGCRGVAAEGGGGGCGGVGVVAVVVEEEARGGAWSNRSGGGESFGTRPENLPKKFSGGGSCWILREKRECVGSKASYGTEWRGLEDGKTVIIQTLLF
ncbi:hypothetical protein Tco_1183021 [Tanacetum coccineum]